MTDWTVPFLAFSWGGLFWNLGAIGLFALGLFLILVILIQDSKEGGLGGAFGGGGMASEVLGARGQKDINRLTAIIGGLFAVLLLILGVTENLKHYRLYPEDEKFRAAPEATEPPPAGEAGAGAAGGSESGTPSGSSSQ